MKKVYLLFCVILLHILVWGQSVQQIRIPQLLTGDFLFQDLDCGPQCDAIESVTQSYNHQSFSHVGIVENQGDSIWVIEATYPKVKRTPLQEFLKRSPHTVYAGRLAWSTTAIEQVVQFCKQQIGLPYDHYFLMNNGHYYCSELLYDALQSVDSTQKVVELFPMTFKKPHENAFHPVWEKHFKKLKCAIPEGELGCNPGGISRSKELQMFELSL
jgi:hypothetical protein